MDLPFILLLFVPGLAALAMCALFYAWMVYRKRRAAVSGPDPRSSPAGKPAAVKPLQGKRTEEMERLLAEISRDLKILTSHIRARRSVSPQTQEKIGRLLGELQQRLRQLDEGVEKYETRAAHFLEEAAKAGIVVPPP